ncbi:alpha-mannosidase, partial [Streptomyces sp. SID8361]|uniref:glycoside hydrolase family 38 C-terminal domain-containing protein n=1 Tax=Streptomyces sp. MnatMP-M27 TaxID=1839768 RepID=UPI00081DAF0A
RVAGLGAAPLGAAPRAAAATSGAPHGAPPVTALSDGQSIVLDNDRLRVTIDAEGLLTSVLDLDASREVLAPGSRGNLLQLHPDHPNHWDAWDIDRHYRRSHTDLTGAESVELIESGPLRATVRVIRSFGASRITQELTLAAGDRRLDIATEVDWQESEKVLKAAFPLDIHAKVSTAEIQFGHVDRATHTNTSWDAARFEICAHRWLRVAEPGYGTAVLNDSTYGHDVTRTAHDTDDGTGGGTDGTGEGEVLGTTVRLTLLRAPHSPDPETDLGVHRFRYALLPGAGVAEAVAEGLALNLPLRTVPAGPAERAPVVSVDNPAITIESVKLAEDRSGDVVVRLYESQGGRAAGTLVTGFPVLGADVTDLLERPLHEAATGPGGLTLALRPHQILTLRLRPVR